MTQARDLDTLIAIAKQEEKETNGSESAQTAVIHILAAAGGALPVNDLINRYGVSKQTLAALIDPEFISADKRRKARVKLGTIDSEAVAYLTPSGVQASGRSVRSLSVHPSSQSLRHALAPSRFADWVKPLEETLAADGVQLQVSWGPSCRAYSERVIAMAWAKLRISADTSGNLGILTGGQLPDFLVIENRTIDDKGAQHFLESWGVAAKNIDELAETTIACEIQLSERTQGGSLRPKVDAYSAAIEILGAAHRVVWIADRKVAKILISLGVNDEYRRPGQVLISAASIGMGNEDFETNSRWWVLDVPRPEIAF
ncbi:MAG: hypothetical protein D4R50_00065 [Actinomycetales bacterium]|nr:MAG: hypothetical protein D4R50_00065 [Actinomycetales bacterium]